MYWAGTGLSCMCACECIQDCLHTTCYIVHTMHNNHSKCCVCSKYVLDNDTAVQFSLDGKQREAVAHASCAGYTTCGASRAKFLCADHRASELLQASKSKLRSQFIRGTVLLLVPKGNNNSL